VDVDMLVEVARDVDVDVEVDIEVEVARVVGADVDEPLVTVTLQPSPQPARPKRSAPISTERVRRIAAKDTETRSVT
jgi:hypothetical protein